jgi:hypothetical protein
MFMSRVKVVIQLFPEVLSLRAPALSYLGQSY